MDRRINRLLKRLAPHRKGLLVIAILLAIVVATTVTPTAFSDALSDDKCFHPTRRWGSYYSGTKWLQWIVASASYRYHSSCFIYDAPPRTANRMVSEILRECLRTHEYNVVDVSGNESSWDVVPKMLSMDADQVAVASGPLYLDRRVVAQLRKYCGRLSYVTSTNSMTRRLARFVLEAVVKHSPDARHVLKMGNNWTDSQLALLARVTRTVCREMEEVYEAYPFACIEEAERSEGLLRPNAVLRSGFMEVDLPLVLLNLGCSPSRELVKSVDSKLDIGEELNESNNTDRSNSMELEYLVASVWSRFIARRIPLRFNDARHRRMVALGFNYSRRLPIDNL